MKDILKAYDPFETKAIRPLEGNVISVIGVDGKDVLFKENEVFELMNINGYFLLMFKKTCGRILKKEVSNSILKREFRKLAKNLDDHIAEYKRYDHFKDWTAEYDPQGHVKGFKRKNDMNRYDVYAHSEETRCLMSAYGIFDKLKKSKKLQDDKNAEHKCYEILKIASVQGLLWSDKAIFHLMNNETTEAVQYAMKSQELYSILQTETTRNQVLREMRQKGGRNSKRSRGDGSKKHNFQKMINEFLENNEKYHGWKSRLYRDADKKLGIPPSTSKKWLKEILDEKNNNIT